MTALEQRLKASILLVGGFRLYTLPGEIDAINFAPRVRVPTLMINGRHDFGFPVETSQKPLLRLLGVPEKDKRHALMDSGHMPNRNDVIRESLDWLDRYLGTVNMKQ